MLTKREFEQITVAIECSQITADNVNNYDQKFYISVEQILRLLKLFTVDPEEK